MTSVLQAPDTKTNIPVATEVPVTKKKVKFPLTTWGGLQKMVTSYSMDYGKKAAGQVEKRPCSPTRRNRPHPSEVFLNWRVPSQPLLSSMSSLAPYLAEYSDILQNFSDEYKGKTESKRKGSPTNVGKETTEDETLKLLERLKISVKPEVVLQLPCTPSPNLNPEAISLVADLLKKASPQEQEELGRIFGLSVRKERESPIFPPYSSFISADAVKVLEQVLQKAGISDNDSAIRFLLSIGQVLMSMPHFTTHRPKPPPEVRKHELRSAPTNSPIFFQPKHPDGMCSMCKRTNLNSELKNISDKKAPEKQTSKRYLENVPRLPKIGVPAKRSTFLRFNKRPPQPKVENKFATFVMPHRAIPRSFTIHPEWE